VAEGSAGERIEQAGEESLIGDHGRVAFNRMIDDSYGSSVSFEHMYDFLHAKFFPRVIGDHYI